MNKENTGHSERAHALLSASGSSRWLNCTPSARLEDGIEDKGSVFAREGTLAHEIAEAKQLLVFEQQIEEANNMLEKLRSKDLYSPEMEEYTDAYVDYIREIYTEVVTADPAANMLTEFMVNLSKYVPQGFGTIDNMLLGGHSLHVIDLKYGKGVKVSAENNSQLKLYALGALENYAFLYDIETVVLHIHQPRLNNISVFEIPAKELLAWGAEVSVLAEQAFAGEGELKTGDWCTFCKVRNRCRAVAEEAEEVAKLDFQDPNLLSDEELLEVYAKSARLVKYLNGIGDYMLQEALSGKKWEGFKLVQGRSNRKLTDEKKVQAALRKAGFKQVDYLRKSLETLGNLEKLVGGKEHFNKILGPYVVKPPGKPTLVEATDNRPEIDLASDFDDDE